MRSLRFIVLILPILVSFSDKAQEVSNVHFEQEGKVIHIFYNLNGVKGQTYNVFVYCSVDDEKSWGNPLQKVAGDVGENLVPGLNKRITWDVLSEKEKLSGVISFQVEAKLLTQFSGATGYFVDNRDGKRYKWVRIGNQNWMAQNLNIGTKISIFQFRNTEDTIDKYCYDNLELNCDKYGGLYTWSTTMLRSSIPGCQGICPSGWHIPTDDEWTTLTTYLGGGVFAERKLKEAGTNHWDNLHSNEVGTNESGFNALPGGMGQLLYEISGRRRLACFWTSSTPNYNYLDAYSFCIDYNYEGVNRRNERKSDVLSVRCIKDSGAP